VAGKWEATHAWAATTVGPARAISGQLGEVYVEALAEDVGVIAEAGLQVPRSVIEFLKGDGVRP